jgi:hypothetical protein
LIDFVNFLFPDLASAFLADSFASLVAASHSLRKDYSAVASAVSHPRDACVPAARASEAVDVVPLPAAAAD